MKPMRCLRRILECIIPCRKIVFLESRPDLSDNTKAVFDELQTREFFAGYKYIWWVKDKKYKYLPKLKNVKYVDKNGLINQLQFQYYNWVAKCLIYCNRAITKYRKDQLLVYLGHISPLKNTGVYFMQSPTIDICVAQSKHFQKEYNYETEGTDGRIEPLGYPRTDAFSRTPKNIQDLFSVSYEKIIVWYPTFRQNVHGINVSASSVALPIIHDAVAARRLNDYLIDQKVLLVIKPHFSQDTKYFQDLGLSNIVFITDEFYWKNDITSYEFVNSCDALITDYSSIYYDYTLKDLPIAVIWEDLEEYSKKPGFAVDVDYYFKGAFKIYSLPDFKKFIHDVATGNDELIEQRREIRDLVNLSTDGRNAERVADCIIQSISKKDGQKWKEKN